MNDYPAQVMLLIDGQWRPGQRGRSLPVLNPAHGRPIGAVACAEPADVAAATAAAQRGFVVWSRTPAIERRRIMHAAAALLRQRRDAIATLLTLEQGKPLPEARAEIDMAGEIIEWLADEGCRVYGRTVPARQPDVAQTVLRLPVGPVAAFTPWNFPLNQVVRKLAAALASGCAIVVKAAEETPASPAELLRAFVDAGVPAGVIGLLYGDPAALSSQLIADEAIRKISFTGSTAVGRQLAALAGQHMKRCTMELGGHAPVIVAEDANPEDAAQAIAVAKFRNAGQICAAPTRMLVHQRHQGRFVDALVAHAHTLRQGNGLDAGTTLGPLAHARRAQAMQELTRDAVAQGMQLACGGQPGRDEGFFFQPTVLVGQPSAARVWTEEPFGPLAVVASFVELDEAITQANHLPYGLAAYAFSHDARHIHQLSQQLQAGLLWINHTAPAWPELPFGGVKDSGYGSEGGPEALEPYLAVKSVSVRLGRG